MHMLFTQQLTVMVNGAGFNFLKQDNNDFFFFLNLFACLVYLYIKVLTTLIQILQHLITTMAISRL